MNTLGLHFKLLLDLVFFFLCLSSTTTHPGVIRRFCCHGSRVDWRRKAPHEATGKSCLCHKTAIKKLGGCECLATWKPYSQNKKSTTSLVTWTGLGRQGQVQSTCFFLRNRRAWRHVFFNKTRPTIVGQLQKYRGYSVRTAGLDPERSSTIGSLFQKLWLQEISKKWPQNRTRKVLL